jgi:hypothetical protein
LTDEHAQMIAWLRDRLNRSGNSVVRVAITRMYKQEQREMLIQAGFPDGRVP